MITYNEERSTALQPPTDTCSSLTYRQYKGTDRGAVRVVGVAYIRCHDDAGPGLVPGGQQTLLTTRLCVGERRVVSLPHVLTAATRRLHIRQTLYHHICHLTSTIS